MHTEYKPLSQKGDASTFVPSEMREVQLQGFQRIPKSITQDWDSWVAGKLQMSKGDLWEVFSCEQIDAIGICIFNFERGKGLILGDETGIGKGRTLSGISRWAFVNNLKVIFFTEREHLISSFYRDLEDTKTVSKLSNPFVLHSNSKVFNSEGEQVLSGTAKKTKDFEKTGAAEDCNIIFTNYSQLSLKQHQKDRLNVLKNFASNAILVLDECHNAAGDSNTKEGVLALAKQAKHCVFSSATHMKSESQIDLYQGLMEIDDETSKILKVVLGGEGDNSIIRKTITYEMARSLVFLRREHEPLEVGWETVCAPQDEFNSKVIASYSEIVNGIFSLINNLNKNSLEQEQAMNAWFAHGALINRLSRNLLLTLKIDTLVEAVAKSIQENRKAVIALDSTFAGLTKNILQAEEGVEGASDTILNFSQAINLLINEVLGSSIKLFNEDNAFAYRKLLDKTKEFESLTLSPIDSIIEKLSEKGIQVGEISGRNFKLVGGKTQKMPKNNRVETVSRFNDGEFNVAVLTRAGASGISLHAGANFKDQRVRDFYELEITTRPDYRLQFVGRVNRKNQVNKPNFLAVITDLPFEQRILNVEKQKMRVMQSHISGDLDKLDQENVHDIYNEYTNSCAKQYLENNRLLAYQMGVSLKNPKGEFHYVDSILKRCLVLTPEQQNSIYDFLLSTTDNAKLLKHNNFQPKNVQILAIKSFWNMMTAEEKQEFSKKYKDFPYMSLNQFAFKWVGLAQIEYTYQINSLYEDGLKRELQANLSKQDVLKSTVWNSFNHLRNKNLYNMDHMMFLKKIVSSIAIGKKISLSDKKNRIFGYIHDIHIPGVAQSGGYSELALLHIKTVDPSLDPSISYINEDYYISLKEIFDNETTRIYEGEIDWGRFNRGKKELKKTAVCWCGHPIFAQYMKQIYGMGDTQTISIAGKNQSVVFLPNHFNLESAMKLRRPLFEPSQIMDLFIAKKMKSITSSWQDPNSVKPVFKISTTKSGYDFYVAKEVATDRNVVDFPLKRRLNVYKGSMDGYRIYHIEYKHLRGLLHCLENKEVIWFFEN